MYKVAEYIFCIYVVWKGKWIELLGISDDKQIMMVYKLQVQNVWMLC